jgi:hypothetical protein
MEDLQTVLRRQAQNRHYPEIDRITAQGANYDALITLLNTIYTEGWADGANLALHTINSATRKLS